MKSPHGKNRRTYFNSLKLPHDSCQWIKGKIAALSKYRDHKFVQYTRLAFSQEDKQAREVVRGIMADVGLDVRVDTAGNIIGKA